MKEHRLSAMAAFVRQAHFCKDSAFNNFLRPDETRCFSNCPIGAVLGTHFLGFSTQEYCFSLLVSLAFGFCVLRGNALADNYFLLSAVSLSILLGCLCIAKFQTTLIIALSYPSAAGNYIHAVLRQEGCKRNASAQHQLVLKFSRW